MRPNEFDDLIRRKFDQGDFEYNPDNWSRLEDKMDKKATRRKILMWLPLAPVAYISSVAASLAMIITIPVLMQHKSNSHEMAQVSAPVQAIAAARIAQSIDQIQTSNTVYIQKISLRKEEQVTLKADLLQQVIIPQTSSSDESAVVSTWNSKIEKEIAEKKLQENYAGVSVYDYSDYYKDPRNDVKTSISLIGGLHYGTINGYSIGANGKRMLGDKFYVESDLAFVDNTATGTVTTTSTDNYTGPGSTTAVAIAGMTPSNGSYGNSGVSTGGSNAGSRTMASTARMVNARMVTESTPTPTQTPDQPPVSTTTVRSSKYDLYYAQVTPTVGYNIHKNFSVGVGADIQQFLQSDKPLNSETSSTTITTDKPIPDLDLGLVGKTEVAISKTVRAGVYYRQDMNNVVNPGSKYADRSYMQLNLKFAIFRK